MPYAADTPVVASGSDEKPILPKTRVKDGWHGHSIYRKLEQDDSEAEIMRANIDYQIDGGKPYSEQVMRDAGRGDDANVNFLEAKAEDDLAQTPFIEMGNVSPTLWRIKTKVGTLKQQKKWNAIMSEKFSEMVRDWEDFNYYRLRLAQQFTRHGAGFVYWEDELDWRWRSDGLSAFKVPRGTESRASAIPYCTCKRQMEVTELYAKIRDEHKAKEDGRWNVKAVRQAILRASSRQNQTFYDYQWEDLEKQLKENDTEVGQRAEKVQVYHLWVVEYNGEVSHYIGLRDGIALTDGNYLKIENGNESRPENIVGDGFLYTHRFRFPRFCSSIIPFFYSIGTHASVHTIRGQGYMNFAPVQISNRTRCTALDAVKAASLVLIQTETAAEAENLAFVQTSGFLVTTTNAKVNATAMPDVSTRLRPFLDDMQNLRRQLLPMSSTAGLPQQARGKQPLTKYQVQADQNRGGSLGSAMLTMWFDPMDKVGREMFRRAVHPDLRQDDPGGKEAFAFRAACMSAGVPEEAMRSENCKVTAVRTIGNGSPEQRQYAAEEIWEMATTFDTPGYKRAQLEVVSAIPGVDYELAAELVGDIEPREPIDDQIAKLENSLFSTGTPAPVTGEQDHWVHCQVHQQLVDETLAGFQEQQIDTQKVVQVLKPLLDNMSEHLQFLSKDKNREKEAAKVRKAIQNANGTLEQQENKLLAEMRRQQEQMSQAPEGGQLSADEQRKAQMHAMKLQQMQQEIHERQQIMLQKLQLAELEARARMRQADLRMAMETTERNAELASGMA